MRRERVHLPGCRTLSGPDRRRGSLRRPQSISRSRDFHVGRLYCNLLHVRLDIQLLPEIDRWCPVLVASGGDG